MSVKKRRILILLIAIVVGLVGIVGLRINSWNQTFGLTENVITGEKLPNAEETIRLYFYYSNRQNWEKAKKLLGAHCDDVLSEGYFEDLNMLGALKLLEIQDDGVWETPEEIGTYYQVWDYNVTYNQSVLYAASWETRKSECYRFILAQERQDGPWMIYSIGHG